MDQDEQVLRRAIATISQSDPLTTLLQQVISGRLKPSDPGLRAVTEAWLATYQTAIGSAPFPPSGLRRLDPSPRVEVLLQKGIVHSDHPSVTALLADFRRLLQQAGA